MSEPERWLDEQFAALDKRTERLAPLVTSPTPQPAPPRAEPLGFVRVVLFLFTFAAVSLLMQDFVAIFSQPDDHVFVAREEERFHVWRSVHEYERSTGKQWDKQPFETIGLVATFHGEKRGRAVEVILPHLLLLGLSVAALRKLRRAREDRQQSDSKADDRLAAQA